MSSPEASTNSARRLGTLLVGLQFGLIAAIAALALPTLRAGAMPMGAWLVGISGVLLGVWALLSHPLGNFNIHPAPREGGRLVSQGPYRWIRHPMYSCIALCGVAGAWAGGLWWGWLFVAALAAVLSRKAALEEQWMAEQHPGYTDYQARTRRFIPGVF